MALKMVNNWMKHKINVLDSNSISKFVLRISDFIKYENWLNRKTNYFHTFIDFADNKKKSSNEAIIWFDFIFHHFSENSSILGSVFFRL